MGKTVPRRRRKRWEATITYYKISRITSRITSHSHTLTTCNPHSINFLFSSPMPTQVHCVQTWLWRGEGKEREREIQWDGRAGLPNRRPQQKDSSSKLRVENCQTLLRVIIYFYFSSCSRKWCTVHIYMYILFMCTTHPPSRNRLWWMPWPFTLRRLVAPRRPPTSAGCCWCALHSSNHL